MSEITANVNVKIGSDRNFGVVFSVLFAIIGLFPLLNGGSVILVCLIVSAILALVTWLTPHFLATPNRLWFKFGLLLGAVIAPVVMSLVFFFTFVPIGLLMRVFGKDPLQRKLDKGQNSYWEVRKEQPQSMKNQF